MNKTSIELTEIDSVYPLSANIENSDLVWKSDNENIASVTDGIVTAKGKGKTTITVSTSDGKQTAKCAVNVNTSDKTITNDTFLKTLTAIIYIHRAVVFKSLVTNIIGMV